MCSISVIIPVYNTEQYIDAIIEFVFEEIRRARRPKLLIVTDGPLGTPQTPTRGIHPKTKMQKILDTTETDHSFF